MTVLWIAIAIATVCNGVAVIHLGRRLDRMVTVWTPTVHNVPGPHVTHAADIPPRRFPEGTGWDGGNGD